MKLAEALQERADLNTKISELRQRIGNNAIVQEGESPAEDPLRLLSELDQCVRRLCHLMARINLTNSLTKREGQTITELIAKKDALRIQVQAYREAIDAASQTARRATRSEIKIISALPVAELQKKADALSKELRVTDNAIQELNWQTELSE